MSSPEIKIQLVDGEGPLLAYAKVPLTLFNKVHLIVELKVLAGKQSTWVASPERKEGDSWVPVVQIPEDIFQRVKQAVLLAYSAAKASHIKTTDEAKTKAAEVEKRTLPDSPDVASLMKQPEPISIEGLSVEEIIKLQPKPKIHLPDRNKRIKFLEKKYGQKFKGKLIKFMTNRQLYAISKSCGYR